MSRSGSSDGETQATSPDFVRVECEVGGGEFEAVGEEEEADGVVGISDVPVDKWAEVAGDGGLDAELFAGFSDDRLLGGLAGLDPAADGGPEAVDISQDEELVVFVDDSAGGDHHPVLGEDARVAHAPGGFEVSHYNTSLVLGIASEARGSMATAARRQRARPLKTASAMW